jgi:hypothetical protein
MEEIIDVVNESLMRIGSTTYKVNKKNTTKATLQEAYRIRTL